MKSEVMTLCRDEAAELATKYIEEITASNEVKMMKICSNNSNLLLEHIPLMAELGEEGEGERRHICD